MGRQADGEATGDHLLPERFLKNRFRLFLFFLFLAFFGGFPGCAGDDDGPSSGTDGDLDAEGIEGGETDGDGEGSGDNDVSYPWNDHSLGVMTFNVMCSFCSNDQGGNESWTDRLPHFGDIVTRHAPDLVGLQELTFASEVQQILDVAPGYQALYPRDLPENIVGWTDYPDATILYREERFTVEESGVFWLSDAPDEAWSGGWADTNLWRVVVWARFRQVSDGHAFYFASTHFDNNYPNQEHSAPLTLSWMEPWADEFPVIFVGDFNSRPDSIAYGILSTGVDGRGFHFLNAYDLAGNYGIITNQTPEPTYDPESRIDHIWLAGTASWSASDWVADLSVYGPDNQYPSDHFPVACRVEW